MYISFQLHKLVGVDVARLLEKVLLFVLNVGHLLEYSFLHIVESSETLFHFLQTWARDSRLVGLRYLHILKRKASGKFTAQSLLALPITTSQLVMEMLISRLAVGD